MIVIGNSKLVHMVDKLLKLELLLKDYSTIYLRLLL